MDGSGLFQVFVTLAVILLAIFALGKARRKPAGDARGDGHREAQDTAAESSRTGVQNAVRSDGGPETQDSMPELPQMDEPYMFGLRREIPGAEAIGLVAEATLTGSARPSPWKREDSRAIRKTAWRLYRGQYWKVMPLFAATVILGYAAGAAVDAAGEPSRLLRYPFVLLLGWFLSPVLYAGSAFAALHIWRGKTPRIGMLAAFLKPRRFSRAMYLTLIQALAQAFPALFLYGGLTALARNMDGALFVLGAWVLPVLVIALGFGGILWVSLRTSVAFYALANDLNKSASEAFETGFRATRGRLRPLIGMAFVTGWPFLAVAGLAAWVVLANPALPPRLTDWASAALFPLYIGYNWLAEAGLADRLLADDAAQASPERPSENEASGPSPGEPLSPTQ